MAPLGAARSWFEEGRTTALASYVSHEEMATHDQIFTPERGGYRPPLMWYKAQIANGNTNCKASLAPEKSYTQLPTLLISADNGLIAIAAMQEQVMPPFVKDFEVENMNDGHWLHLKQPEQVNEILNGFFEEIKAM